MPFIYFKKDTSYRDGRRDQCEDCVAAPRLSTEEHTYRLREDNLSSEAVKKQRWANQLDYMNDEARLGKRMHSSEFLLRLRKLIGWDKIFLTDGNFLGDIAVYRISGVPRPDFDGSPATFKYLWYLPTGWMTEYSVYEFNERLIPVREIQRGWRTPLLRLIKQDLLTENQVNWEFGTAEGEASVVYRRELYKKRNNGSLPN